MIFSEYFQIFIFRVFPAHRLSSHRKIVFSRQFHAKWFSAAVRNGRFEFFFATLFGFSIPNTSRFLADSLVFTKPTLPTTRRGSIRRCVTFFVLFKNPWNHHICECFHCFLILNLRKIDRKLRFHGFLSENPSMAREAVSNPQLSPIVLWTNPIFILNPGM